MFYFVPSWYGQKGEWQLEAPVWFRVFESLQFDDTIHQVKMFQEAQEEVGLLLLSYQPQLRYFLHKQDLLSIPYWSFFDQIQQVRAKDIKGIDFKSLNWPAGTRFIYTPFAVVVKQGREVFAEIHFAENGNLLHITHLDANLPTRRYVFDDRGFLSSLLFFENGQPAYRDYLNPAGVWQVREFLNGKSPKILVNRHSGQEFKKRSYRDWNQLMLEKLQDFRLYQIQAEDYMVISANDQHNQLLIDAFPKEDKIFSFFENRFDIEQVDALRRLVVEGRLLIADSQETEAVLLAQEDDHFFPNRKVTCLPPFDTRLRLGRSQTLKELIVYFLIDGIPHSLYWETVQTLLEFMEKNPLIELQLVTYDNHCPLKQLEQELISLVREQYSLERFMEVSEEELGENQLEEEIEWKLSAVSFHRFTNENQIIASLDKARLVLDLSSLPHLYTQIASLSAGIPQLNAVESDYLVHQENGWLVHSQEELRQALTYYLEGLSNWNKSLVYTVQKMGDYTSGRVISQWKELLKD